MDERELGICCGDFYNHPVVSKLLDGIFHPGGLALSKNMADRMGIDQTSRVLDIASGDGKTVAYLAKVFGCEVAGIDANPTMIANAKRLAEEMRVSDRAEFKVAIAGEIPFANGTFTAAISECSLCTFLNKEQAISEISRVLVPKGVFGLNDVTVRNRNQLDEELQGLLGRVACIADAFSAEEYIQLFENSSFSLSSTSNHSHLLEELTRKAKARARFISDIGRDDKTAQQMADAIRIMGLVEKQIESGNVGYDMFIFERT